jgi:hypothetical protein
MSIEFKAKATSANLNNAFVSKTVDSKTEGKIELDAPGSGTKVDNLQQAINTVYGFIGKADEAQTLPPYTSTNYISGPFVVALDALDTEVKTLSDILDGGFGGDVTGTIGSNTVTAIRSTTVGAPANENKLQALVYDLDSDSYKHARPTRGVGKYNLISDPFGQDVSEPVDENYGPWVVYQDTAGADPVSMDGDPGELPSNVDYSAGFESNQFYASAFEGAHIFRLDANDRQGWGLSKEFTLPPVLRDADELYVTLKYSHSNGFATGDYKFCAYDITNDDLLLSAPLGGVGSDEIGEFKGVITFDALCLMLRLGFHRATDVTLAGNFYVTEFFVTPNLSSEVLAGDVTGFGSDTVVEKIQGNAIAVPDASSVIDIQSTAKGSRPFPRMTEAQRDAIATPATGLIIYNTESNTLNIYDGLGWTDPQSEIEAHLTATEAHGATGAVVGTTNTQTLTNKTLTTPVIDVASLTEQSSTPATPSAGTKKLYAKNDNKLYSLDSDGNEVEVGSGAGGGGGISYLENSDAEQTDVIWELYTNTTAGAEPTPNSITTTASDIAITRSTSSPLGKTASWLFTKDAAVNRQGSGIRLKSDFMIQVPAGYQNRMVSVQGPFTSTFVADGLVPSFWYLDTTWKQAFSRTTDNSGRIQLQFQPVVGFSDYVMYWHIATTETDAAEFKHNLDKVNSDSPVQVGIVRNEVIDVTGSGDFTGGKIRVTLDASGGVMLAVEDAVTHASLTTASSAAGLVPQWARPSIRKDNVYVSTSTSIRNMTVLDDGKIIFAYDGNRPNSGSTATISYNVAKPQTALLSTTELLNETDTVSAFKTGVSTGSTVTGWTSVASSPHFNATTGVYTVPKTGDYLVTVKQGTVNTVWTSTSNALFTTFASVALGLQRATAGAGTYQLHGAEAKVFSFNKGATYSFQIDSSIATTADISIAIVSLPNFSTYGALGGRPIKQTLITASGDYTPSPEASAIKVTVVGGGGGGGGTAATGSGEASCAGGGQGGGCAIKLFQRHQLVTPVSITIGTGGSGATAGANDGANGTTTSFGSYISGTGGQGGAGSTASSGTSSNIGGRNAGEGVGGDINVKGGHGDGGVRAGGSATALPNGGAPFLGSGTRASTSNAGSAGSDWNDNDGGGRGSGGAGARSNQNQVARAGGAGGPGFVLIEEWS